MAGLSEMLFSSASESSQKVPELGQAVNQGAQLAQHIQNVEAQRLQMEQAKQELQIKKVDKLTSAMETGAKIKSKSARNAFFKNYIPKMQAALGLQDFIPEDTMNMIQADPEQAKKLSLLKSQILNGQISYDQAVASLDPEQWASLDDSELTQLEAAEKFRVQQANTSERAAAMAGQSQVKNTREDIDSLRKEFISNPVSKETKEINSSYDRIKSAFSEEPSAAADLSGIFAYMKMLDPGSTVKEGEFANAQDAAGIPDRIVNHYNNAIKGEMLNPDQRADFLNQAQKIKRNQEKRQGQINSQYESIAKSRGYNPKQVLAGVDLNPAKPKLSIKEQLGASINKIRAFSPEERARFIKGLSQKLKVSEDEIRKQIGE